MATTDPIADLLTRIRNGIMARKATVEMPSSKQKISVLEALKAGGFIYGFEIIPDKPQSNLVITLKYATGGNSVIREIKRVSKLGCRIYRGVEDIKPVLRGMGMAVVSTSQGILTDSEARKRKVGGEVLLTVW